MTSDIEAKEGNVSDIMSQDKEVLNIDSGGLSALSSIKG